MNAKKSETLTHKWAKLWVGRVMHSQLKIVVNDYLNSLNSKISTEIDPLDYITSKVTILR